MWWRFARLPSRASFARLKKTYSDFLYTTRSPYWAQKALPTGKDVNVSKIERMAEIFDRWEEDSTPVKVQSWDAWKASHERRGRKGSRDLEDENYLPASGIGFSSKGVLWFDTAGQQAEELLFQTFKRRNLARSVFPTPSAIRIQ